MKINSFNSILRIQKVRTELTVLTSSNMLWLGVCFGNITFSKEDEVDVKRLNLLLQGVEEEAVDEESSL